MANGWSLMWNGTMDPYKPEPPKKPEPKPILHPEVAEIKDGEELLVVNFKPIEPPIDKERFKLDSPALHPDPLHKALQDRIKALEDDDDGDGDVPAIAR